MTDIQEIADLLERIIKEGHVPVSLWPDASSVRPQDLGLRFDDGHLSFSESLDVLDKQQIQRALPELVTSMFSIIDSTNTQLVKLGTESTIANHLYLAEFQYGGRGRRGRRWLSPYGRNLSMSLGAATSRELSELGGLSLVVGLALADGLEKLGVAQVQLKWPNDVLVNSHKLCGILVELVQRKAAVEIVMGIGVNVSLTPDEMTQIGQPAADLQNLGVTTNRSGLVVALITKVRQYLQKFEAEGFEPFVQAFNNVHQFHDQTCSIIHGTQSTNGRVVGVGPQGELILLTETGEQRFHGGEVSLRSGV